MKKLLLILLLFLTLPVFAQEKVDIYSFYGQGCPHCEKLMSFFSEIKNENLNLNLFEIYSNETNRELFYKMSKAYNATIYGVPTTFIDESVFIGFSDEIKERMNEKIDYCTNNACSSPKEIPNKSINNSKIITGNIDTKKNSYGIFILIGLLSLAVILMFAVILVNLKKDKKGENN